MLYFHRRQKQLIGKIPHGFLIGKSLGDGNCLYNSVSICLFGDETKAHALRLQSVLSAVSYIMIIHLFVVSILYTSKDSTML